VPLPFIARVQSAACDRLAAQLRSFFTEGDAPTDGSGEAPQPVATPVANKSTSQ